LFRRHPGSKDDPKFRRLLALPSRSPSAKEWEERILQDATSSGTRCL